MKTGYKIKLFLPESLKSREFFMKGQIYESEHDNLTTIIITDIYTNQCDLFQRFNDESIYQVFGYYGRKSLIKFKSTLKHFFEIDYNTHIVKRLVVNRKIIHKPETLILYFDHDTLRKSETIPCYLSPKHTFTELNIFLKSVDTSKEDCQKHNEYSPLCKPIDISFGLFAWHLLNYIEIMLWMFHSIKKQKRINIKHGNIIMAIIIDILLGYYVMALLDVKTDYVKFSNYLMGYLEMVVSYLRSMLNWLMGAPAGLKLNNAFNNMLGKFFLYHIELWWMFLELAHRGLDVILRVYHYFGYLGFTFQAAIISDIIFFGTFHLYCIYVYVARLFNIQISGLIALMRLFFGRKQNPLRGGIDSCEYTNQELFVGTVAFTIILFLLPTTTMYYIVFTLFRLLSLGVQGLLSRLIYYIQTIPLYVVLLWCLRSPRVAGNIFVEVVSDKGPNFPLILRVKLLSNSLGFLINNFKPPPINARKRVQWTELLSNVFRGKLIK